MKTLLSGLFLLLTHIVCAQFEDDYSIRDQFIVMLKPGSEIKQLFTHVSVSQQPMCLSQRMNIWSLQRNTTNNADAFLDSLRKDPFVKLAQFDHRVQPRSVTPNDPSFPLQWSLHNTGQNGGTPGADVDAEDAWTVSHGNLTARGDTIVVAIVDVAFDYTHPDLNFFVNHHEIPNNGIDDDGNGYVDDYYGWNTTVSPASGDITSGGLGYDHSMHCAGIAGAIADNNTGIAGVCWGPQIMRVCGASNTESQVVAAYAYVIEMRALYNSTGGAKGAFVVSTNSSFGIGNGGAQPADYPIWCAMYDTMGFYGILSATAAPDYNVNVDIAGDVPTGCPSKYMISVTNTTSKDQLLTNSAAYGPATIDIGAPGTDIYSTYTNNSYGYMTGTSMSSPMIAGAVAEMLSAACPKMIDDYYAHPDSVALILKQMLMSGNTRISDLYNETVSGGRLNLYHAVLNLDEYNCNDCAFRLNLNYTQPTCSNTCDGSAAVSATGAGGYSYAWSNGVTGDSAINNLCPGYYLITVTDSSGCAQTRNFSIFAPDSLVISNIDLRPVVPGDVGNIIVTASVGNYQLQYSADGINYQSSPTLIVDSDGNYNVYVKSENGCMAEEHVSLVSGNSDLSLGQNISVYPVPTSDALHISLNLAQLSNLRFSILNSLGEVVMEENKTVPTGVHIVTADVSTLAGGLYWMRISSGGDATTRKFVVIKK